MQKLLLGKKFKFPVKGRNLIVTGMSIIIAALSWKFYVAITEPNMVKTIFLSSPSQIALYIATFVSLVIVSNGFALMAKERSDTALRKAALLDKLTGCWNRVRIEEILQQEMARMRRYGHPAALLMMDLDKFKYVNDQFGHLAGDEVLRGFGRLLRTELRATDVAGRWGGEEFIVVLPSSTFFDAVTLAEHIRERLQKLSFSFGAEVTVSIGVAACRSTDSIDEWIKRADLALYRAKINGRNQVKVEDLEGSIETFMGNASSTLYLPWSDTYECGHDDIDEQHRNLFETVNSLLQVYANGAGNAEIADAAEKLLAETVAHFRYEENILKDSAHTEAFTHSQAHKNLLARANMLLSQFQNNGAELAALLHFMIYELTAQHIMIDDRCFAGGNESLPETPLAGDGQTPPKVDAPEK